MKKSRLLSIVSILAVLFAVTACNKKKKAQAPAKETKTVTKTLKDSDTEKKLEDLRQELAAIKAKTKQEAEEHEELMAFLDMNWEAIDDEFIILNSTFLDQQVVAIKTYIELKEKGYLNAIPTILNETGLEELKDVKDGLKLANELLDGINDLSFPSKNVLNAKLNLKAAEKAHKELGKTIIGKGTFKNYVETFKTYSFFRMAIENSKKNIENALKVAKSAMKKDEKIFINDVEYDKKTVKNILKHVTFNFNPKIKASYFRVNIALEIQESTKKIDEAEMVLLKAKLQELVRYQIIFERVYKAKALKALPDKLYARNKVYTRLAEATKIANAKAGKIAKKFDKKRKSTTVKVSKYGLKDLVILAKSTTKDVKSLASKTKEKVVAGFEITEKIWNKIEDNTLVDNFVADVNTITSSILTKANAKWEERRLKILKDAVKVIVLNLQRIDQLAEITTNLQQNYVNLTAELKKSNTEAYEKTAAQAASYLRKVIKYSF